MVFDLTKYNETEMKIVKNMLNSLKNSVKSKCNLDCDNCDVSNVCSDCVKLDKEMNA